MGLIKLGDFGLAVQIEHSCSKRSNQCGTLWYSAPEAFDDETELKSDIWSLGISLIELAEGKNPYAAYSEKKTIKEICYGNIPSLSSSDWSSEFVSFVKDCLVRDVEKRKTVNELMKVSDGDDCYE